ncbi:MAG: hypothetical protein ACTSQF_00295 [Candidatus Heimdallarchaeaceae archaeon]
MPDQTTNKQKKSYGKTNRNLGHSTERYYASEFRDLGYSFCKTSRQASRLHDDAGIDLVFIPFNVQVKAGKQRGLNPILVLKEMNNRIIELFPEENEVHSKPNMVILKKATGHGIKRTKYDEVVIIPWEDFKRLIKKDE